MQTPDFPPAPDVDLFTRFVLENPWPLAIALAAIAAAAAWIGLRDGRKPPLNFAAVLGVIALAVLATGLLVTTPAERGKRVTRDLVDAAIAADISGAMALFSRDAVLTLGSPQNPGFDIDHLRSRLMLLENRYRIRSNRIGTLNGYTAEGDMAIVHLACWTDVDGYGNVPSRWVLRIERQDDDTWLITRLTAISIAGRPPPPGLF